MLTKISWTMFCCVVCLAILLSTPGCTGCSPVDKTMDTLGEAIAELGRQPDRWKATMLAVIQQLEKSGTQLAKNVLAEVRHTYNSMLQQTAEEASCEADFIAKRLQQRLQAIGHAYAPERFPEPTIQPVICSIDPRDPITPDLNEIVYSGYDLLEFKQRDTFTANLQYADGTVVMAGAGKVAIGTNYMLKVDLQSPQVKDVMRNMDPNHGPQIVLKWGNYQVPDQYGNQSALPIQVPTPVPTVPPPTTYEISIRTGDVENAGTSAYIVMTIYGRLGNSQEFHPDNPNYDDNERGTTLTYNLYSDADLGDLYMVRVSHDNSKNKPGWFLDWIKVVNLRTKAEWYFPCYRWLATTADDHKIAREIEACGTLNQACSCR